MFNIPYYVINVHYFHIVSFSSCFSLHVKWSNQAVYLICRLLFTVYVELYISEVTFGSRPSLLFSCYCHSANRGEWICIHTCFYGKLGHLSICCFCRLGLGEEFWLVYNSPHEICSSASVVCACARKRASLVLPPALFSTVWDPGAVTAGVVLYIEPTVLTTSE